MLNRVSVRDAEGGETTPSFGHLSNVRRGETTPSFGHPINVRRGGGVTAFVDERSEVQKGLLSNLPMITEFLQNSIKNFFLFFGIIQTIMKPTAFHTVFSGFYD